MQTESDAFQSADGSIVLCASLGKTMEFYIYLSPFDDHSELVVRDPDVTFSAEYESGSIYTNSEWSTYHKGNAYNRGRLALLSNSDWQDPSVDRSSWMTGVEWLELDEIVRAARALGVGSKLPLRRRNVLKHSLILLSWDDQPLCGTGSGGYFLWWKERVDGSDTEYRIRLVPFFDPNLEPELGWDRTNCPSHTLRLPVNSSSILSIEGWCDEAATLFVLTESCQEGCCPRALRLFEY